MGHGFARVSELTINPYVAAHPAGFFLVFWVFELRELVPKIVRQAPRLDDGTTAGREREDGDGAPVGREPRHPLVQEVAEGDGARLGIRPVS
jgi:hypothetical protein